MFAVNIKSGKVVWEQPAPSDTCKDKHFLCNNANMAAPTLAGGYLFSGSSDGFLRVYDTNNGRVVWAYDTARKYIGINGVTGVGGAINRNGPTIVNGMLYQNSGYGHIMTGMPGHVLLAFEIPDAR